MSTPIPEDRATAAPSTAAQVPRRPTRRVTDIFFKLVEGALALMLVAMLLMVLGNVILRYGFGTGISASEELSRTLFVWITFVGAVVATRDGAHLGVDSMIANLPHRGKVACAVLSEVIVLACCVLIFWGTWQQHAVNATTASLVTGMPLIWVFGVGYVVSLGIGTLVMHKLWRIATGNISDAELFDAASTEVAAEAAVKGGHTL